MPTYDYKCPKCETVFEVVHKMSARHVAKCPKCGTRAERQLSGGHGIVFKGTGFYETDYKRKGEKRPEHDGPPKESPKKPTGPPGAGGTPSTSGPKE